MSWIQMCSRSTALTAQPDLGTRHNPCHHAVTCKVSEGQDVTLWKTMENKHHKEEDKKCRVQDYDVYFDRTHS